MQQINPGRLIAIELFGIDPGKGGGIAKHSDRTEVWNMPGSYNDLCDFLAYQKSICKNPLICLEKVNLWKGDKDGVQFGIEKLKDQYVEIRSAIKTKGLTYIEVPPISWQSFLKIRIQGEDKMIRKRRFKDIASDWYPSIKVTLHTADALLLVEYLRRMIKYNPLEVFRMIDKFNKKPDKKLIFG